MFWQLFGTSGLLVLLSLAILGIVISRRVEQSQLRHVETHLRATALLIEQMIQGQPLAAQRDFLSRFMHTRSDDATRVTLIQADGYVIGETHEDPAYLENHGLRPEVLEARTSADRFGMASRGSKTLDLPMMYVALRVNGDTHVAYVRVALPLTRIHAEIAQLNGLIWSAGGLTAALSLLLAFGLARRFCRPLQELSHGADRIASGVHGFRVWVGGPREVRQLGESFNNMSERLAQQFTQLEEDRQQLRTVLSSMVEGVIAVDPDLRVLFANERAGQLLNFPQARAVGRPLWDLVRQRSVHDIVRAAMTGGQDHSRELEWNGPATRSLSVHVARLPGKRGAVLVLHDNTELRRLENLRREFAANVSHELKTPLSTIKACVETLIDGAVDDAQHRGQFLDRIAEQAERLHRLILDLLHLSRIESETEVFSFEELDLDYQVAECLERHRTLAENKKQTLEALPPPAAQRPVTAWADEEAIDQILDNLVDNALKYTPEGGRVAIRWGVEDKEVFIEVRDTGIGIPENELPRIFERFYRVDKARSRELGGTGLGLSIVKHLAQAMHGSVEARSQLGQGTSFTVRLPGPA